MKLLLSFLATLLCTGLLSQNLDYINGYTFDVESGLYYNDDNIGDLVIVNHTDTLTHLEMEWQPDSVMLSSFLIRDDMEMGQIAALASECGIETQAIGATPEDIVVIISETECNYEFRRLDEDPAELSIPSSDFTALFVFLDNPNSSSDNSAALITSDNTTQKATGTDHYVLLTGHTTDTLGFQDVNGDYTDIDLAYDNSGYIIAVDDRGRLAWHYENESETDLSFISAVAYINDKIYVAHDQIWKSDILVLSEEGELLESYTWEGVTVNNMTGDMDGNIYLCGYYNTALGNADISFTDTEALLPKAESFDAFVAKYDSQHNLLWSQTITGEDIDTGVHCDVDERGDIFVTGSIQKDGVFDQDGPHEVTFEANGIEDVFVAKYSAHGQLLYANTMGGTSGDIGLQIKAENGEIKLWGLFRNTIDLSLDDDISYLFTDENDELDESYFYVLYSDFTLTHTDDLPLDLPVLTLYPNPAGEQLMIAHTSMDGAQQMHASVTDLSGRTIAQYSHLPRRIDVSDLPESIYTLHVQYDNGLVQSQRFVVTH